MADSRWRVGSFTSLRTFAKTDGEVAQILAWFMLDKADPEPEGLTPAELNQWRLDQAHDEALRYIVREAYRNRTKQLREEFQDSLEEQVQQETEL